MTEDKRRLIGLFAIFLLASLSLACGIVGARATPVPAATATPQPTYTPLPTYTPVPTHTPLPTSTTPPTKPPAPTATPQPAATATKTADATPVVDNEGLSVLTHNGFTDSSDTVHVVGQVVNNADTNFEWVTVKVEFYDKDEKLLAEEETYAYVDILVAGEAAPFKVSLWEPVAGLDNYVVSVTGDETSDEPFIGIQFVQDSGLIDDANLTIIGEVTNSSEIPASNVRIAAAILDESGEILDVGFTFAERDIFLQDSLSPFELFVTDTSGTPDRYNLIVYADEAADWELDALADLELNSIDHYIDTFDDLIIVGEVTNDDSENVGFASVFASFYDENDELVAVGWDFCWADILEPGQKTPFEISLFGTPPEVDHWTVWVEGDRTDAQVVGKLVLEETDNTIDDNYVTTFTGQVLNDGPETMESIELAVTVYDAEGNVVMTGWTWLEGTLAPNATMPFEFEVQTSEAADSFNLYVQGDKSE